MIDRADPPEIAVRRAQMIRARDRAVVDAEGERPVGRKLERDRKHRLDRAAMRDRDDVAPGIFLRQPFHRGLYSFDQVVEAFAARRALVRWPEPERHGLAHLVEFFARNALPLAEMLLGEFRHFQRRLFWAL